MKGRQKKNFWGFCWCNFFYKPDALPINQSKHWKITLLNC